MPPAIMASSWGLGLDEGVHMAVKMYFWYTQKENVTENETTPELIGRPTDWRLAAPP
jgi:hypothetical protein